MKKALVDSKYKLQKFPGKGGWTYVVISEIPKDQHAHFGMVRVKGKIDNYEIKQYNLMPMSGGTLFLPIKAGIRKIINKKRAILFISFCILIIHRLRYRELEICLRDEPSAYKTFMSYTDSEKKAFIDWIYSAKREETKISRIAKTMKKLQRKLRLYDIENNNSAERTCSCQKPSFRMEPFSCYTNWVVTAE